MKSNNQIKRDANRKGPRSKRTELTVITKTYDLILWSCNHTNRFPRNHRFVLGEKIDRNLYELVETLLQAKYQRQIAALLDTADLWGFAMLFV